MSVIFLLIPLSVIIATGFLAAFIWCVKSGQYEDTCTPSMRLLLEETDAGTRRFSPGGSIQKDASSGLGGESRNPQQLFAVPMSANAGSGNPVCNALSGTPTFPESSLTPISPKSFEK